MSSNRHLILEYIVETLETLKLKVRLFCRQQFATVSWWIPCPPPTVANCDTSVSDASNCASSECACLCLRKTPRSSGFRAAIGMSVNLRFGASQPYTNATWLILPVVICLSKRLSHASLSISDYTVKLRIAHYISYSLFDGTLLHG